MVVGVLGGRKDRVGRLSCRVDPNGRLLIDAAGGPGHVSLRFDVDGLGAFVQGIDALVLPGDVHGEVPSVMDRRTGDCWMVTSWTSGRGGPMGIGLQVAGEFVERARPLRLATTSWWQRWDQAFSGGDLEGTRLPMLPSSTVFNAARRERETLRALTELLARRHEARTHLTDPARAARRLATFRAGWLATRPRWMGSVVIRPILRRR